MLTNCVLSALSADEADDVREAFAQDFADRSELMKILNADANRVMPECVSSDVKSVFRTFRRLAGG